MTSNTIAVIILICSFLLLMVCRLEIAFAMGISTILTLVYLKIPLTVVYQGMVAGTNSFTFLAVPFFVFMGDLMSAGKVTDKIMELAEALVGWMRGGLAMVNCVASFLFGGISGSAIADVASLGPIECDLMKKGGYDSEFSWSLTMASSIQGMLVPPSHNMVIYACAAGAIGSVAIDSLLIAGVFPGAVLCVTMCLFSYVYAKRNGIPVSGKFSLTQLLRSFITAFFPMLTVLIVVGGVVGGIMTATEASAFAVTYALVLVLFGLRTVRLKQVYAIASKTVKTLASVMVLIAVSNSFGWLVAFLGIPKMVANALLALTSSKYILLLLSNLLLLFLGMFMSMGSILLIVTPILLPVLMQVGVDPVHFGVLMIFVCGIGLLTPPVGGVLYVASGISGIDIGRLSKKMLPFYAVMIIALLLVTYIPQISLWLPGVLID